MEGAARLSNMNRKSIMGIVAFLALLSAPINGQDVVQPDATSAAVEQQKTGSVSEEIKLMGKLLKEVREVLSTIQGAEGAVDKVEAVREKFLHIDEWASEVHGELSPQDEELLTSLTLEIGQELKRLAEHDCYGVEEVGKMVDGMTFFFNLDALTSPPAMATDKQREQISKRLTERMEQVAAYIAEVATGGLGLTRESAWVMKGDTAKVVSEEYAVLGMLGFSRPESQSLMKNDGKVYDVQHLTTKVEGGKKVKIEMWFDITAYWNNPNKFEDDSNE